jgi:hypothetical protein
MDFYVPHKCQSGMMNHKNPNKENTPHNTTMHIPTKLLFILAMVFELTNNKENPWT